MSNVTDGQFFSFALRGQGVIDTTVHPGMGINKDSNVFATVHEIGVIGGVARPFIGIASIQVLQIAMGIGENNAPMDGAISIRIQVLSNEALDIRVCLLIFP